MARLAPALLAAAAALALTPTAAGQIPGEAADLLPPPGGDIPGAYRIPSEAVDYTARSVMIPMRDGVRLHTVILIPKGARDAPIVLTRTPYGADKRSTRQPGVKLRTRLPEGDDVFVEAGYIRVYQDVRGKYGSEGEYVMTRPVRGPLNPTAVDHTTDAWDTVDWLVRNVPESNGRVGLTGSSYEGFTVAMALLDPHPAVKVASPQHVMGDGWMGDDWFHYGAFRQYMLGYFYRQTAAKGEARSLPAPVYDDYDGFLRLGSAGAAARAAGFDQLPWWRRLAAHPAYDAFWQGQALDRLMAARPSSTPTLWVHGLWDQEDGWGSLSAYAALKAAGRGGSNHLVLGPWRHSQVNYEGRTLGPLQWDGDTSRQFRRDVLRPFFDAYLRPGAPPADTPPVLAYNTGEDRWERLEAWPRACERGCADPLTPLFLQAGFRLDRTRPPARGGADAFVSDPAKPVPYMPRPVRFADRDAWQRWLVSDQRHAAARPDVLTYVTEPLSEPVRISGRPVAELHAVTTGTDADWVVKVIDVYPDEHAENLAMSGYQLPVSMDIFRGRYRESFEHPTPIPSGKPQRYRFALPAANHVFLPGHRIMVQVQSSLFPLYDRNPQTYVPNIFQARPEYYRPATHTLLRDAAHASAVLLPVVSGHALDARTPSLRGKP